MLLLIDIGNTNITVGVSDNSQLVADWRISTRDGTTADEFWVLLQMLFDSGSISLDSIQGLGLSSVVPSMTSIVEHLVQRRLNIPFVNVTSDLDFDLEVRCENPQAVGADRLCNAVSGLWRPFSSRRFRYSHDFRRCVGRRRLSWWNYCTRSRDNNCNVARCSGEVTRCRAPVP